MSYATLRWIHIGAVAASFCGFLARGLGLLSGARWVRHRLTRVLPHVVDTVLLLSAAGMLLIMRLSPLAQTWLEAKICGLFVYIVLGFVALQPARSPNALRVRPVNLAAWIGALVIFGYIVSVALTRSPAGVWLWLQAAAEGSH